MITYLKQNHLSLLIILWLVVSGVLGIGGKTTVVYQDNGGFLGAANREATTITNPFTFQQGVTISNNQNGTGDGITITGTSTVQKSYDGFVAGGSLGTSATTTPVQTLYTNTGGNVACDASTMALHVLNRSVFNPAQSVSVGTTTASGAATDNLIASSTMATSSPDALGIESYIGDNAGVFILQPQDRIQISLRDGDSAAADTTEITASSTNYASRDIEFGVWCWNLSI